MIVSAWGREGDGKSSFGLSYPKPLFHLDLDVGGFERAIWRVVKEAEKVGTKLRVKLCEADEDIKKLDWAEWDIVSKPYPTPVQMEKLLGVGAEDSLTVRFPRQVTGVKEVWQSIVIDIVAAGQASLVKSIMPDSATQLWWICHTGYLQEKQEIQLGHGMKVNDPKFREKLQPVEYPNDRVYSIIYTTKSFGKHLIMTHYPKDVYKERVGDKGIESYNTGEITPDGFKHTLKTDDIVIWCYTETDKEKQLMSMNGDDAEMVDNPNYNKPQPHAQVSLKCGLAGMGMSAVGKHLPTPSYEGLMELQADMRTQ